MQSPTLRYELALWQQGKQRVSGVDECGVGPLAGPVVAAACVIPPYCEMIPGVRDSKQLLPVQREALYPQILGQALAVGVGAASVRQIERINVYWAARLAMRRALARVSPYDFVLIDGLETKGFDVGPHTCIVGGDVESYAIACASIVAKVTRDRLMRKLGERYPGYGWDSNAGYTTKRHVAAMQEKGLTPFHRKSYRPVELTAELLRRAALDARLEG